jgi:hypothetical protein
VKSIGDFALNIIPNIDTIKLYSGISALDSLGNIASKIFDTFKKAYNVVDDSAESLRNLAYVGKELNMPAEQIKVMERTMVKFGLSSEQAANALKSIAKFKGGAPFGEFDTGLIMKAGLLPTDFGKDWKKNLELLSKKYSSTDNINVRSAIESLVPGLGRMLTDPKQLRSYIAEAQKMTDLSGVDWKGIEKYGTSKADMSIAMDNLAIAFTNAALPGLTVAIVGLTELLNSENLKNFINFTGNAVSTSSQRLSRPYEDLTIKERLWGGMMSKFPAIGLGIEALKWNFDMSSRADKVSKEAAQAVQVNLEVHNNSDGSNIDTKIKQQQVNKNREMQQANLKRGAAGK